MKTTGLSVIGLGAALALAGCSQLGSGTGSPAAIRGRLTQPDHAIKISHDSKFDPDTHGGPRRIDKWSGYWELKEPGAHGQDKGALRNMLVKTNASIEWQNEENKRFSIVVTNTEEWGIRKGETNVWLQAPPPFDGTNAWFINSKDEGGTKKVVELLFKGSAAKTNYGYWISVPTIDALQTTARALPNYENMVEATLIWDSSKSREQDGAPSQPR